MIFTQSLYVFTGKFEFLDITVQTVNVYRYSLSPLIYFVMDL